MAFPLTHLCVAWRIIERIQISNPAQFILGSIAPDAVHFRVEFAEATQANIGPAKKITHLCPISSEKWGYVTDNDGWVECVKDFLRNNENNPFTAGYAVHVLTDIANNMGPWKDFITNHPQEAAKGYTSAYYTDLKNIDLRLYHEIYKGSEIEKILQAATPQDMPGLVSEEEVRAIQENLLHVQYANVPKPKEVSTDGCVYVTYEQTLKYIEETAEWIVCLFAG